MYVHYHDYINGIRSKGTIILLSVNAYDNYVLMAGSMWNWQELQCSLYFRGMDPAAVDKPSFTLAANYLPA